MNYYLHPYVSNSNLTEIKKQSLSYTDLNDYTNAYRLGTLIDAMITTPDDVDYIKLTVLGTGYDYSKEEFDTCRKMKKSFMADPFCLGLLKTCTGQQEFYKKNVPFEKDDFVFNLNTRCKYDLWSFALGWGGDIKSTAANAQKQFEEAVRHFDYDRQRYFYMKNSGARQDVIVGISKNNFQIFKVFIKPNTELLLSGERKTNDLAYRYWCDKIQNAA